MNNYGPIGECRATCLEGRRKTRSWEWSVPGPGSKLPRWSVRVGGLKGIKAGKANGKSLLEAELFMQKVREGREQIKALPKSFGILTWFRMFGVWVGGIRLEPGHGILLQQETEST